MKDEEIYACIKAKNQEGLSCLLDKYGGLMAYIIKNTGDFSREDVSECISDVLYTVWKRIDKYDKAKASFKTWIVMITRGCAIDCLRKNKRHKNVVPVENIEAFCSENGGFDVTTDNGIIDLLQKLAPPDNEIFYRRFVLGENAAQIAEILGLTPDVIYKRISRGKEKLKNLMDREGYCYV